jgi:tight adherence protein B
VAVDRGAGLAAGLDRLEGALCAERDQRADLRAQLAGSRSTAVMLAGLPVLGLLLGTALGADPLHVLLHSGPGLGCLVVGGVLEGLGLWWALRIVRGAEAA